MRDNAVYRKVLFIACSFPPTGSSGVQRSLKFAKYLPEFGWLPDVVAGDVTAGCVQDASLCADIPPGCSVERVRPSKVYGLARRCLGRIGGRRYSRSLKGLLDLPDGRAGWILPAYRRARRMIADKGYDAIYTTSSPYSDHVVGWLLKRATGLPWVADFRDEWIGNPWFSYPTRATELLNRRLERAVLASCDHVISVSEPIVAGLRSRAPAGQQFSVITNGYDAADIAAAGKVGSQRADPRFTLAYAGLNYDSSDPFFRAIDGLLASRRLPPGDIRIRLAGDRWFAASVTDQQQPYVEVLGYLAHLDALAMLLEADCLLLWLPTSRGSGAYTGKIFELIALGRPILAMVPEEGVAAELIRASRTGVVVPPEDPKAIASAVLRLYEQWRMGACKIDPDWTVIQRYERKRLTAELAGILDKVTAVGQRARGLHSVGGR